MSVAKKIFIERNPAPWESCLPKGVAGRRSGRQAPVCYKSDPAPAQSAQRGATRRNPSNPSFGATRLISVTHLFRQLVPAHLVADARPHLPLHALRRGLGELPQPDRLPD